MVRVDRNKTKTTTVTSLEVFRMREKDIPVDVVEMKATEELNSLFWEPKGNKFAIIATEASNKFVYFYEVQSTSAVGSSAAAAVVVLKHFEAKGVNTVKWSPKGRFCVLAGVQGQTGDLQFWDVDDLTQLSVGEHYGCTNIEWDSTGRYAVSFVSAWHSQNDHGLIVWSLAGQELAKQNIVGLKQFLWRPRPKSTLPIAVQKKIRKNLKEYSREFDEEDSLQSNKASTGVQDLRKSQMAEFKAMIDKFAMLNAAEKDERVKLYGGFDPYEKRSFTTQVVVVVEEEVVEAQ